MDETDKKFAHAVGRVTSSVAGASWRKTASFAPAGADLDLDRVKELGRP